MTHWLSDPLEANRKCWSSHWVGCDTAQTVNISSIKPMAGSPYILFNGRPRRKFHPCREPPCRRRTGAADGEGSAQAECCAVRRRPPSTEKPRDLARRSRRMLAPAARIL